MSSQIGGNIPPLNSANCKKDKRCLRQISRSATAARQNSSLSTGTDHSHLRPSITLRDTGLIPISTSPIHFKRSASKGIKRFGEHVNRQPRKKGNLNGSTVSPHHSVLVSFDVPFGLDKAKPINRHVIDTEACNEQDSSIPLDVHNPHVTGNEEYNEQVSLTPLAVLNSHNVPQSNHQNMDPSDMWEEDHDHSYFDNMSDHCLTGHHNEDYSEVCREIDHHIDTDKDQEMDAEQPASQPNSHSLSLDEYELSGKDTIEALTKYKKLTLTKSRFLGYLLTLGHIPLTAKQYQCISSTLNLFSPATQLPTYKTIRTTITQFLLDNIYPKSSIFKVKNNGREDLVKIQNVSSDIPRGNLISPEDCICLVLPSEWAKIDLSTPYLYYRLYPQNPRANDHILDIETVPVVRDRFYGFGNQTWLWALYNDVLNPAPIGTPITLVTSKPNKKDMKSRELFPWFEPRKQDQYSSPRFKISGFVGPMWMVGGNATASRMVSGNATASHQNSIGYKECTYFEKLIVDCLRDASHNGDTTEIPKRGPALPSKDRGRKQSSLFTLNDNKFSVSPGDICVLIRPLKRERCDVACLFVGSFIRSGSGFPCEKIIWVKEDSFRTNNFFNMYNAICCLTVNSIPQISSSFDLQEKTTHNTANNGRLLDGNPFHVYRFALYTDGFKKNKSIADSQSVTGCYLMPVGLPLSSQKSSTSVRVLTIIPPKANLNIVLDKILDDVLEGTTRGIQGTLPNGTRTTIFLDMVALLADYVVFPTICDLKGHSATSFCTTCNIQKHKDLTSSQCMYTTSVHSRRLGHIRLDSRNTEIRKTPLSQAMQRRLGVRSSNHGEAMTLPMVRFAFLLSQNHNIPLTCSGTPVVSTFFDSNQHVPPVPDHCVSGVIKNLLEVWFSYIATDKERSSCEIKIIRSIIDNGLPKVSNLLKWDNKKSFASMENISMTSLFTVLFVSSNIFQTDPEYIDNPLTPLFGHLNSLVSTMYCIPYTDTSSPSSQNSTLQEYYRKVQSTGTLYVEACEVFHQKHGSIAAPLDKPNIHRLLEICFHTIPHYGHALHVSELVLEMAHRTFKNWIEKNRNNQAHISAVERSLSKDRLNRIHILLHDAFSNSRTSHESRICLRSLFLGHKMSLLRTSSPEHMEFVKDVDDTLSSFLKNPYQTQLAGGPETEFFQVYGTRVWKAGHTIHNSKLPNHSTKLIDTLRLYKQRLTPPSSTNIRIVKNASLVYESRSSSSHLFSKTFGHHTISNSSPIYTHLESPLLASKILHPSRKSNTTTKFFFVVDLLLAVDAQVWALVYLLDLNNRAHSVKNQTPYLLSLDTHVRRAGIFHECSETCVADASKRKWVHHKTLLDGGRYRLISKEEGYPPRMG